jgi:hypothetical protein
MSTYIQNYGITKTVINDNQTNEIKWLGDYDGNIADIRIELNNNGDKDTIEMQLDNNDIMKLLGIQTVEIPLEKRLLNDFMSENYEPLVLAINTDNTLIKRKNQKYTKRRKYRHRQQHNNVKNKHSKRHYKK